MSFSFSSKVHFISNSAHRQQGIQRERATRQEPWDLGGQRRVDEPIQAIWHREWSASDPW